MVSPADRNGSWLLFSLSVQSMRQKGPSCGLVALQMVSTFACTHEENDCVDGLGVEELLSAARQRNFSKKGEIFFCEYLAVNCTQFTEMLRLFAPGAGARNEFANEISAIMGKWSGPELRSAKLEVSDPRVSRIADWFSSGAKARLPGMRAQQNVIAPGARGCRWESQEARPTAKSWDFASMESVSLEEMVVPEVLDGLKSKDHEVYYFDEGFLDIHANIKT
eukprot:612257-Hanusia_phi.AAC.1